MTPEVLILSSLYDFSTDLVCLQLEKMGVPFLRLNREHLHDCGLTLNPCEPSLIVRMAERTYVIGTKLKSVWFRQPVFLRNTPAVPLPANRQLERSQWMAFLRGLSVFDHAAWMNFPAKTYLAESKPYQLYTASRCGFEVPTTLATNDAQQIRDKFQDSAIIKSLDTVLLLEGEDCLFTYTTLGRTSEISDNEANEAPFLAQELLKQKTDLRVTLIGDTAFAVKILSKGSGIEGDWRVLPRDELHYEDVELSAELRHYCGNLALLLGLSFAAIDLIETPEKIYFIEVNPTGEWGWINGESRPIDATIASWLADPPVRTLCVSD